MIYITPPLLKARVSLGRPGWIDSKIAEAVEIGTATAERVRQRCVLQCGETALVRKPQERPSRLKTADGRSEAKPIALARAQPPDGRKSWVMPLPTDKLVESRFVSAVG